MPSQQNNTCSSLGPSLGLDMHVTAQTHGKTCFKSTVLTSEALVLVRVQANLMNWISFFLKGTP